MLYNTDNFLDKLEALLDEYNVAIVRSKNSSNDLVIRIQISGSEEKEILFPEAISAMTISNEWYLL